MVAIVSGIGAGLNLGSREVLGQQGVIGKAAEGRNGQGVYVNVATGLLVVQNQDDFLAARGHDAAAVRTYNSAGTFSDDNGDNWSSGVVSLTLTGTLNATGSTVSRIDADGSTAVYAYNATRGQYLSNEGAGAYDTVSYVATDSQFEWRDGSTGATQRYEGSGARRLLSSKDTSGNALSYAYGAAGFLSSVTSASGDVTHYDYVGSNLSQVRTVAGGATTTRVRYGYDASNRLNSVTVDLTPADNSVTDGKVYQTSYAYDGTSKRIASITQSDGTSLTFAYVDVGGGSFKVASVRDGLNQTTTFTYATGYATATDALGLVTRYDFDVSGRLTKITAPAVAGAVPTTTFTYSANGDVASILDGQSRLVVFSYDTNGNQVLQRDWAGNAVTRTYDVRNQLLTETVYFTPDPDASGVGQPGNPATTRYVYDAGGRNLLRFSVTQEGRVSEHRYNGFGERVASITYGAGLYPTAGLATTAAVSETDLTTWAAAQDLAATQRTDFAYDGRGQLQLRTAYARVGSTGLGLTDGSQSVQSYVYDQAGQLLQTVSAAAGTSTYTHDGLGRVLSSTNALGQLTLTQYADAAGKTIVTLANGLLTTSAYDAAGRLVSMTDSNAAAAVLGEKKYFYDASNRLRMTQDATGVRSWTIYDAAGRKAADVDGNGTMTEYLYDRSGLLTYTVGYATAANTALLVDAAGQPITAATVVTVRPTSNALDVREWRSYDAAGRLLRTARSFGNSATVAITENRYDGASRLVEVMQYATTPAATSVSPGTIAAPAASTQDRSSRNFYSSDGLLAGTLDAEGYLCVFNYSAAGQIAETIRYATATDSTLRATGTLAQLKPAAAAGDVRSVNLYDGKGQLIAAVDGEGYLTESVYDASGNVAQTVRYANRVTATVTTGSTVAAIRPAITAADRSTARSYDKLNRPTQETSPEGVVTQYAYDAVGNLSSTSRAVGTTEVRTLLARYDLQGRLTGELSALGASLLIGGLTQAQIDTIWVQHGTSHAHDAASRRISSTDAAGNRTLFFYNADGALTHTVNALGEVKESRYDVLGRIVEEYRYSGRISTAGLSGGLLPSALTTAVAAIATSDDLFASYTYAADGRVRSTGDGRGNTTTTTYNAFGEETATDEGVGGGVVLSTSYTVDRRGQRTQVAVDPTNAQGLNAVTSAIYDAFGRATRTIDGNGNVRQQSFDRLGRVVTTIDPLNAQRSTSYDAFDRVLTQTDAPGKVTSYAYDRTARSMTVTTPEGIASTTVNTRHGQVQSITDGKGQVTSYGYDRNGKLLTTTTPLTATSSTYDALGRQIESKDANGFKVAYTYDAASRVLTRRVDPTGMNLTTTYAYDGKGQQVSVTDPNGVVTTAQFDNRGRVLRQTVDPTGLNLQTVYSYDARGNVLTVTSPGGSVTQYVYDVQGRRVQERVEPTGLNLTRSWAYDDKGNVTSSTDARGNVIRYAYDADDRLVYTLDPMGNLRHNGYDAAGRVIKTVAYTTPIATGTLGAAPTVAEISALVVASSTQDQVQHRVYDKDGRLVATVDATGGVTKYSHDANGNLIGRTSYAARITMASWVVGSVPAPAVDAARDETVKTVYDALDRAIYSVNGIGAVVAQSYDANGNVLKRTAYATPIPTSTAMASLDIAAAVAAVANSARDDVQRNVFDAAGRLTWSANGLGAVTGRGYDKNGNVIKETRYAASVAATAAPSAVVANATNDRATSMAYDAANRLVFSVDALRAVTEQVHDRDGNVVQRVKYSKVVASVPTLGAVGTVAAIRTSIVLDGVADRTSRFGYDGAGRQVLAIDALGAVTETVYDGAGNVVAAKAYATVANTSGLIAVPTLQSLRTVVIANPAADRTTRQAYDGAGRLVYTLRDVGPSGTLAMASSVEFNQYNGAGMLTRTTRHAGLIDSATSSTVAGIAAVAVANVTLDQSETHTYNAAGQRLTWTDALAGRETYAYDALGRRLTFTNPRNFVWTYTYDAAGNQLTEATPIVAGLSTVSVDASGKLVASNAVDAAIVTTMAYDALGNLTQRTEATGRAEARTTRYEYDAVGRQVRVIYPPVAVYNAAGDAVTTNGATGAASRVETIRTLETQTFYDAQGNAVASRDVGGAISQKAYDVLGNVAYDVDAMGFVTGYTRNVFGEVTSLVRYSATTTLANTTVTQASQAATRTQVSAAVNAAGVDHTKDRTLLTTYDRAGRVAQTTEPSVYVYDSGATDPTKLTETVGKTTRNAYDAFGQLVQIQSQRNSKTNTWSTTTHYYDVAGRQTATIGALGHVTTRTFDVFGNLTQQKEYGTALQTPWTISSYSLPTATATEDRTTTYAYDRLNRKTTESRLNVEYSTLTNGTSVRGTLTTTYGYDAVGNQTRVTSADGSITYTYFDSLGRVLAVAAPSRTSTVDGTALIPLTVFRRDAYGNVLAKVEYVKGAATGITPTTYQVAAADPVSDRVTVASYDSFGRSTQSTDASGASSFTSYDEYGHVAKSWQGVTGNDGVTRTAFSVNVYDKLGQILETRSPASTAIYTEGSGIGTVTQAQAGIVTNSIEYNAFGEVIRKGLQGVPQEYFDYDNAGRLWRTNAGDGIDKVNLYDAEGNLTAEIRSAGSGRSNVDIKTFATAQVADANPYTRRTDIKYDALGRVVSKTEAAREEVQGGVSVLRQFTSATVVQSSRDDETTDPIGSNKVSLSWSSLAYLGSGDIKVQLQYRTALVARAHDESGGVIYIGGTLRTYSSDILTGDSYAAGLTLEWKDAPSADVGVSSVERLSVCKKDVNGVWQLVIDQTSGYGANEISVVAPPNPYTALTLQMRAAGSTGDTGWWTAGLVDFGNGFRFDARGLTPGNYEYRVTATPANDSPRVIGTGTVAVTQPPLNSISTSISYGPAGVGVLAWSSPGASYNQTLRYRVSGSTGAWSELPVTARNYGYDGVNTYGLPAGTYQFELLWSIETQGVPSAHATGTFTVVAAVPAYWVPPQNLPPIGGLSIGTTVVGGTLIGYTESGAPIYAGGSTVNALIWNAAGANVAAWRVSGGAWNYLTIDSNGQTQSESGYSGVQKAAISGIAPGTYQVLIQAGSPASTHATGTLTIYAQNPGHYETRYGTRTASRQVWVDPPPEFRGYDESGPVYYDPPGYWTTEYYTETYSYQVWVEGTTPTPTISITTPPYTPGYWVAEQPAQYGVSVTTVSGSKAISTTDGSAISQTPGINGDGRWLRPTALQKLDRWGNVIEITDPRAAYWKTTYRYNASNQLVQQTTSDTAGNISASSPVNSIYYDRQGRQIAVKDANGKVNGQVFDAGSNLAQETHADGGVVTHAYNAFGEKVRTTDAMSKVVAFSYDKMGHLTLLTKGQVAVYSVTAGNEISSTVVTRNVEEFWSYDQLGRKLTQTNGNGEVVSYTYDLPGNIVATKQHLGQVVRAAYDAQGHKIAEVDANSHSSTWTYDYFGVLKGHKDLGGATFNYTHDNARQLVAQSNALRGQSLTYSYDAAGQLTTIQDWATNKVTTYMYDLSGRKIRERVVQAGATYQDNHLAYDAQGNLRDIADARAHIAIDYDKVGNRTHITTYVNYQGTSGEASSTTNRYFQYDEMNRQKVVDAVDAAGNLGQQGHRLTYDLNGNRLTDTYWGNKVVTTGGEQVFAGYNEDGTAIYISTSYNYTSTQGYSTEEYAYDNLNRLRSVVKDQTQIDLRLYDAADRVVRSGSPGNLPPKYAEIINAGLAPDQMNGKEMRVNRYDGNGRLMHQRTFKSDWGTSSSPLKSDISWDANETLVDGATSKAADGYDAAGNARSYVVKSHEGGGVSEYVNNFVRFEGYQSDAIAGSSSKQNPGTTTQQFDANGFLVAVADSGQSANSRTFVNDSAGRALFVNQGGKVQRQLIVNGEVLGIYGAPEDQTNTSNNPTFANLAEFNFGYAKINSSYPLPSPGAYTVRTGDTLQAIAQGAYGDSSLWYRIAEANGLASNNDLKVGQTLNIPNRVSSVSNNSSTFKPYDPSKIEGDKTPTLVTPEKKGGCGGVGKILMVIVAVVVSVVVGPGILGAVLGSVASQAVGLATGAIDHFSWKAVALAAVSAGVAAAMPTSLFSSHGTVGGAVARAALGNAITQGVSVVTGLQSKFDWRGVAASAIGARVDSGVGDAVFGDTMLIHDPTGLGNATPVRVGSAFTDAFRAAPMAGRLIGSTLTAFAAGVSTAVARGGRVAVQQVAADAFGNALGQNLASISSGAIAAQASDPLGAFIEENMPAWEQRQANFDQITSVFSQAQNGDRAPGVLVADSGDVLRLTSPTAVYGDAYYASIISASKARDAARQAASANFHAGEARATAALYANGAGDVRETTPSAPVLTAPSVPGIADGYFDDDGDAWLAPITVRTTQRPEPSMAGHALGNQESATRQIIGGMDERLNALVQDAQDRYVQDGTRSSGWRYGLNATGYVASEFFPRSVAQAAFDAVGGPVIGRLVGAGVTQLNKLPILGSTLPQLRRSVDGWFGPGVSPSVSRMPSPRAELRAVDASNLMRAEKGVLGENRAALTFERAGYQQLPSKLPSNNGFDGVFVRKAPDGSPIDIIINESKFSSTGRASLSNTNMGKQMSPEWIDAKLRKMLVSDDPAVRATARLLRNNGELVRTKANVLDTSGTNRWNMLNLPK
jgi:YD repeat-containing protein